MAVTMEEVLAQLNPKLRKTIMVGDSVPPTEYAQTPSFGLNRALAGGLPYGRQVLVWGNKNAVKTAFRLQMIANAQKE
jgi:RecA/RadA recombinase